MTISTIIVSYNTADLTCQAIQSVLENYQQDQINGEVIVVDNNSSDGSVKVLKHKFKNQIQVIANSENLGFAQANNQAVELAQGKYIFFLNSDTVLFPHAIKHLLEIFDKHPDKDTAQLRSTSQTIDRVGVVSGKLLNADGSLQTQGGYLPRLKNLAIWWLWPFPFAIPLLPNSWQYHADNPNFFDSEQKLGWLAGTAMLVRKELLVEVGSFDENIFMYAEDVELCWRAVDHHWDIVYTPKAKITHLGSASSNKTNSIILEISGLKYTLSKHLESWQFQIAVIVLWLGAMLRYVLFGIILNDAEKKQTYSQIIEKLKAKS